MRAHVAPEPIEPDLSARRPSARHLEEARSDAQRDIGIDDLDACDEFRELAALARAQARAVRCVLGQQGRSRGAGFVSERFGGAEVRVEVAVLL